MDKTDRYYDENANEFFSSTVDVDMATLRTRFLRVLKPAAHILDAGCGSGRDAKAFFDAGYEVTAIDASERLARLASSYCGFEVAVRRFADLTEVARYDGVWCCASLLHVPYSDMAESLEKLWRALRPGGCMYMSFKYGTAERIHAGRHFSDADESIASGWLKGLPQIRETQMWVTNDQRPDRTELWLNVLVYRAHSQRGRLVTGGIDHFLPYLSQAFSQFQKADLAVAFIKITGLRLLLPDLESMVAAGPPTRLRVLTSDYLGVTDPEALRLLLLLQQRGAEVRVYNTNGGSSFHLKAYIFSTGDHYAIETGTAFIGSSNISRQALRDGLEWNYRVAFPGDEGFLEAHRCFEELFYDPRSAPLSDSWIESYEQRRIPQPLLATAGGDEQEPPPIPTTIQHFALEALRETRSRGFIRGLVVLATGLGKTWLAAFDAAATGARRILFVAHREEILSQAASTFLRIFPKKRVGLYMGGTYDASVDILCASVQTLSRTHHLGRFRPQHFDYVVVDEFHHASAATYRRLLAHFAPTFMLGLTATPDRTDQSSILSLCDGNLVYNCHLFEGINAGLLAPFRYYGILDESVDYREIPWRSGRFDPDQLGSKLATLARARHVLREYKSRGQARTLAFCVSTRHADFMATQFVKEGISAAAVYAGSRLGRAQALEELDAGTLKVVFSVDLFNEGVDIPSIDTVMMLRPTESKILFLQQLGRGLRRCEGKSQLIVLDFIGNHHSFLKTPQALFNTGSSYEALAQFARKVETNSLDLPEGCYVNYDLGIIEFLKSLDTGGVKEEYQALKEIVGRRPTLTEFYRSGSSIPAMRGRSGHWFSLVREMSDLNASEVKIMESFESLLREIEVTPMTKCFKMILLEAFIELDGLYQPVPVDALARRSREVLDRRPSFLVDILETVRSVSADDPAWVGYWRDNPINAWIGRNNRPGAPQFFRLNENAFALIQQVPEDMVESLSSMLMELVDYRLASYAPRLPRTNNVVPLAPRRRSTTDLPYFPDLKIACGHFKTGRTDSEEYRSLPSAYGPIDPNRHFIARATGNSMNGGKNPVCDGDYLLLELISPANAGSITGRVVAIERQDESGDNQYLLRVVTKGADGQYVLKANNPAYEDLLATDDMRTLARLRQVIEPIDLAIGQSFNREEIPALFGEDFNQGKWNVGHVTVPAKKAHVLLITLNKQGKVKQHRYQDHWVDERTFHWQSQNSTTPQSTRGREIIEHVRLGISIHLFVRDNKLAGRKGAPFVYYGRATYVSHEGSGPTNFVLSVD